MSLPTPSAPAFDRRQSTRIRCAGLARIITLPSEGFAVPAKVLNLSLGGCKIECASLLPSGTRAEIVLRVNAASIRVVGEMQASRSPCVMGVEFLLLSTFGKQLLSELILELARQTARIHPANAARRQFQFEMMPGERPSLPKETRSIEEGLLSLGRAEPNVISIERSAISHPIPTKRSIILNGDEVDVFI